MPERLKEVMTKDPVTVATSATLQEAARIMRDRDIGDVIVREEDGSICGIVTDRDIVVRGVAEGSNPGSTTVGDICSEELVTLGPDNAIAEAVKLMKDRAIRRLPVVENGDLVGFVSIGDLAEERDPRSALGEISSAPANN